MQITETFHSIQGEGPLTGTPMFFVRTNRCNLRCQWCDSTYTFDNGTEVPVEELVTMSSQTWEDWICYTGGEPLLQRESLEFVKSLVSSGKKVLIETGGSLPVEEYTEIDGVCIDMDVKTPSSGEQDSVRTENLKSLRPGDYIKFVISDSADYEYAVSFLKDNGFNGTVVFQPVFGTEYAWIPERMQEDRLNARFMTQMHKHIWGETRGR